MIKTHMPGVTLARVAMAVLSVARVAMAILSMVRVTMAVLLGLPGLLWLSCCWAIIIASVLAMMFELLQAQVFGCAIMCADPVPRTSHVTACAFSA